MNPRELQRYVPLAAWIVVCATLLAVAGKIIGMGYLPADDALRHAAKAVSGKPWSEILVMRPDFAMDPHPGWHAILGAIHRCLNCNVETLVIIPVSGLMVLFSMAALVWLKRPEAWLGALLVAAVCSPGFIARLTLGRPYLVTMIVYVVLLLVWTRLEDRRPGWWEIGATVFLIGAAAWIHGSFYQLILPAAGLLLAGRCRQAVWFGALWAAGSFLGASLTGHPWLFLDQCVRHLSGVLGGPVFARLLVPELRPSDADPAMVFAVIALLLWRSRAADWKARDLVNPLFIMGVLGWLLGLQVGRFWWDWGLPALLVWTALELEKQFANSVAFDSWNRLYLTVALAAAVFLGITSDRDDRWTGNLAKQYLTPDNPDLAGWLPESGGIIYSVDMTVFNDTFFKNPTAPWRYVMGFESALMQPEDLAVAHQVAWNFGDLRAYEPWVKKMLPQDRLIITGSWLPTTGFTRGANIPELEWHHAGNDWWIGRLPRKNSPPPK
jgi:hypothetical protein